MTDDINDPLLTRLRRLAADCERDDTRATSAPWIWTDEKFFGGRGWGGRGWRQALIDDAVAALKESLR